MSIGRFVNHPNYVAVVRTMFLPVGKPPRNRAPSTCRGFESCFPSTSESDANLIPRAVGPSCHRRFGAALNLRSIPIGTKQPFCTGLNQVRTGLADGGRWIRTIGTASESCLDFGKSVHLAEIFASQDATSGCGRSRLRSLRFALRRASAGSARRAGWPYVANSA